MKIYSTFLQRPRGIILHTVIKIKKYHIKLGKYLAKEFPRLTIIIYNGDGITVICPHRTSRKPLAAPLEIDGKTGARKKCWYRADHMFDRYSISEVLQLLKDDSDHNHKHICIIAGHLAARGISFVSSDYQWHLTDQYIHPAKSTHGENLLQSLRILGCYKDNIELNLWCAKETWNDILEQYSVLDKIVNGCGGRSNVFVKFQHVKIIKPHRAFSRPKIMQGTRWKIKNQREKLYNIEIAYQQIEKEENEENEESKVR